MSDGIELRALDAANPLGYLAALGVLLVGERVVGRGCWRLAWSRSVASMPSIHGPASVTELVDAVMADRDAWVNSPALGWNRADDVKFDEGDCRSYLAACLSVEDGDRSIGLASALVAEGGLDNNGAAKPSDFHFTAGQQKFLGMSRELRDGLSAEFVSEALVGPWAYKSKLPSLKWDVSDDRVYALSASDPATDKKLTVPGAEWLAMTGLAALPVFARADHRTVTTGCQGPWKSGGTARWPLWSEPLTARSSLALIAQAHESRSDRLEGWGVFRLFHSKIRRTDQGGYGSFSPAAVVWESDR
jgi:hypothetical protein